MPHIHKETLLEDLSNFKAQLRSRGKNLKEAGFTQMALEVEVAIHAVDHAMEIIRRQPVKWVKAGE